MNNIKQFKAYFKFFCDHVNKWNCLLSSSEKNLSVISTLCEHLQLILRAKPNTEMMKQFPDLIDRLKAELNSRLEVELSKLQKLQEDMNNCNRDLKMRLVQLDQSYSKCVSDNQEMNIGVDKELGVAIKESPLYPPSNELMDMANDAWKFYHDLWLSIHMSLLCIDYEDELTIDNLKKAFIEDTMKKEHINWILSITKFLVENND